MTATPRLVQLQRGAERRVALVDEPTLRLLRDCDSVYSLAQSAITASRSLVALIEEQTTREAIGYDAVYRGESSGDFCRRSIIRPSRVAYSSPALG
jgi:hypothetical protein